MYFVRSSNSRTTAIATFTCIVQVLHQCVIVMTLTRSPTKGPILQTTCGLIPRMSRRRDTFKRGKPNSSLPMIEHGVRILQENATHDPQSYEIQSEKNTKSSTSHKFAHNSPNDGSVSTPTSPARHADLS